MTGVLDTSVFVAGEQGRDLGSLPEEALISVITLAELRVGVLVATDPSIRAQRMRTLSAVEEVDPVPVDDDVAREFSEIVAEARAQGRRPKVLDSLIGATASALGAPVYTQDADFDGMPGVEAIRI